MPCDELPLELPAVITQTRRKQKQIKEHIQWEQSTESDSENEEYVINRGAPGERDGISDQIMEGRTDTSDGAVLEVGNTNDDSSGERSSECSQEEQSGSSTLHEDEMESSGEDTMESDTQCSSSDFRSCSDANSEEASEQNVRPEGENNCEVSQTSDNTEMELGNMRRSGRRITHTRRFAFDQTGKPCIKTAQTGSENM